ncbi:ComF family protein [Latilactobacillus fuchuensis]|uniref:Bacterial type II secretion/competence system, protein ComFC-like n=1 Tax=Latilactobacillus fuchuensis TaxID=164393 RepID=A0A2N9DU49_9LACO|nr:ComF family protein [Latilactobacillus fuchuensis]MCP8857098.1 ComF family protein [Latilactobacillus fuchuensis]SPC37552.1 putative bacterial type II secretion/competence system, protein ComFC-like [Latilactobacillus fuchuensis]
MRCLMCQQPIIQVPSLWMLIGVQRRYPPFICETCLRTFERIGPQRCQGCGRSLIKSRVCPDCQKWQALYPQQTFQNQALFTYNEAMRLYFQRYKGQGDYQLRCLLQSEIQNQWPVQAKTWYVPIPTARAHYEQRGFDPVLGLYQDCFPLTTLLTKRPTQQGQSQKTRAERLASPQFFDYQATTECQLPRKIVLLDDIYTTGRTLWHAQQCLRAHFLKIPIKSITLAR